MDNFMSHIHQNMNHHDASRENKIKTEIADEHCEGKRYYKCNPHSWTMIERALEVQKDVYLCFIDYTEAFDKVRQDEIIIQLTQLEINGKNLRTI